MAGSRYVSFAGIALAGACGRIAFDERADLDAAPIGDVAVPLDAAPPFDPARCPARYTVTIGGSPHRYMIGATQLVWADAMAECAADLPGPGAYTHLIVLGSESERLGLQPLRALAWVGLTDRRTEDTFLAVTREDVGGYPAVGLTGWASGEPNDSGGAEDCVHTYAGGELNDQSCDALMYPVCECDGFPLDPSRY